MGHSARFLDILTDPVAWASRHGIEPFSAPCPGCGVTVRTTIPIARGALRGLRAPDCACGYSLGRMPYGVVRIDGDLLEKGLA